MGEFSFSKEERLCGKTKIDILFQKGKGFIHYPFRIIYHTVPQSENLPPASVLINVSKRKFKRANKRNSVKRLIRETYRLNKKELYNVLNGKDYCLHFAILYLDTKIQSFQELDLKMKGVIRILTEKLR